MRTRFRSLEALRQRLNVSRSARRATPAARTPVRRSALALPRSYSAARPARIERTARPLVHRANERELAQVIRENARTTRQLGETMQQMQRRLALSERSARARVASLPGVEAGGSFRGKKAGFMVSKAIRFLLTGREEGNEFEAEVLTQTEKRFGRGQVQRAAQVAAEDTLGGYLIPAEVSGEIIDQVKAQLVLAKAGMRVITGLKGGPYQFGKKTGATSSYWVGENEAPSESNLTVGEVTATPHTAASHVKISKKLIMMANANAEAMVREDMAEQMALFMDLQALRATGGANAPLGLINVPSINTYAMGTNGAYLTYDHLMKIIATLREANGLNSPKKPAFVMNTVLIQALQLMKDENGRPLFLPNDQSIAEMNDGRVGSIHGYPIFHTTQLPTNLTKGASTDCCEIFFCDWDAFAMCQWANFAIDVTDKASTAFLNRQVWVLATQDVDFVVRQTEKICYVSDVRTPAAAV